MKLEEQSPAFKAWREKANHLERRLAEHPEHAEQLASAAAALAEAIGSAIADGTIDDLIPPVR